MAPKIILAVQDAKRKEAYLAALDAVECSVIEKLGDILLLLRKHPYNGILIDLPLNIKASNMEKIQIYDSLHSMPSATLNYDAKKGLIKLFLISTDHPLRSGCDIL